MKTHTFTEIPIPKNKWSKIKSQTKNPTKKKHGKSRQNESFFFVQNQTEEK